MLTLAPIQPPPLAEPPLISRRIAPRAPPRTPQMFTDPYILCGNIIIYRLRLLAHHARVVIQIEFLYILKDRRVSVREESDD